MSKINLMQKTLLATYENGEFLSVADEHEDEKSALKVIEGCGDSMLRLLFSELGNGSDVESHSDGCRRMENIIEQVQNSLAAIEALESEVVDAEIAEFNSDTAPKP